MNARDDLIAVTGLACRFPGAPNADALWRLLAEEREGLTRLTEEQLAERRVPRRLRRDPAYVPVAGLIDGQELFDPEPFGIAEGEAALMDPQQRLFLETCWRALEQAGHGGGRGAGAVGVFAGAAQSAYQAVNLAGRWDPTGGGPDPGGSLQTAIATQTDYLPAQVAYRLDLTGPAVSVNTACSTSLVAVHIAVQSLLSGECDTALAGGVSLIVPQGRGYLSTPDGIYSEDGRTRPFSAHGTGIVYTQGVGAVVLRRLRDALDDGDPVLAVVHGSAVNNDGADKTGLTAPSVRGQARAIAEALAIADAEPRQVGYVEAHGTGTRLGDPIEVAALRRVFGDTGPAWCGLGSVKSNLGHANSAAGIASFIKTVLAVRHRVLPASLHAEPINDLLGLAGSPFEVVTRTRPWDGPELAGVSSFGIGGTNAHVIVGPAPERSAPAGDPRPHPVVLSAHTPAALERTAADLADWLETKPKASAADIAHTSQQGRRHQAHRLCVAPENGELASALRKAAPVTVPAVPPKLVFAFPGGGSARAGMGTALYDAEPAFAECVDECAELFTAHLGFDIRTAIRGDEERIREPVHGLPALFSVCLATARLLETWGIRPDTVLGHSLGEYTAAVVAGALSLPDAARLVAVRSQAMADAAGDGAMLAVPLGADGIGEVLHGHPDVDLAVHNAPGSCVVSGPRQAVAELERELRRAGHEPTRLRFDGAAHSRLVEPALPRLRAAATGLTASPPSRTVVSTLTGGTVTGELGTADHWVRQLREPVRFSQALRTTVDLTAGAPVVLVHVGPGGALAALARAHGLPQLRATLTTLAAEDGDSDLAALREAAGRLWTHGIEPDFSRMHQGPRRRIAMPGQAFQRRRLWIDPPEEPARPLTEGPDEDEPLQIPVWTQVPPLDSTTALEGRWVVAGDDEDAVTEVAASLKAAGAEAAPLDQAAERSDANWTGVVVLAGGQSTGRDPAEAVTEGVLAHARLARDFFTGERPARLLLQVTRTAQRVTGSECPVTAAAALHALPRVIAQEQPGVRWRVLDLDEHADPAETVPAELADLIATGISGIEAAVRGGARWARGVVPWRPGRAAAGPSGDETGAPVALITGGLGDVGLTTAAHLARKGLRVVVTSRTGPPGDESGDRVASLRRLAEEGLPVEVRRLDAADAEGTARLLEELSAQGPPALVVHAAGVVATADLQPMRGTGPDQVTGHMHAKISGVSALREAIDRLPAGRRPRQVILMSSAGTLVGGIGMGPYCAANRYLDALAEEMSRAAGSATRWVSVVWDAWKVGPVGTERTVRLTYALGARTGMDALDRILAGPSTPPVVAVSTTDLRERIARAAYTAPVRQIGDPAAGGGLTPAEQMLAGMWSDLLGVPVNSADADFFALGGHSLLATRMLGALRDSHGVELRLRDLIAHPTVGALARLLTGPPADAGQSTGPDADVTAVEPAPDGTFPLTRVQHAYWVGREGGYALGEIACHFYLEYDCPDLDLARYEQAWRQVIARHPMLRAIVTRQGRLKVLDHVPAYRIRVHDLTQVDEDTRQARLARLRERISRDPGPPDRWPLVQIRAARLPGGRVRLFIGVDVLICDAGSYWIIDREVRHYYEHPGSTLPEPAIDFAACLRAQEQIRQGADWRRAAGYWRRRLDTLPGPPPLPVTDPDGAPRFVRRTARLTAEQWRALKQQAARRKVTATAVLLTAYAEALATGSGGEHFSITLTLFDRPPIHPDVDKVVGDFTSLLVHEIDRREPGTFAEHVRRVQHRLFTDLDHRAYSALDLLAERATGQGHVGSVPVVFTSALGLEDLVGGEPDLQWVGEQVHAVSQTPQTWLDHQVLVQRGELLVQWDAVAGLLPDTEVDEVFAAYADRLRRLATDPRAWDEPPVNGPVRPFTGHDDVLVPLREGTGEQTLFLLHPSGGDVLCYAELSRLLDERFSIVALTDPGLAGTPAPEDLPGLARLYGEVIRRHRPHGPYLLGGWSMGGSLGQEVACRLYEEGASAGLLLMLDSNDPTYIRPLPDDQEAEAIVRLLGAFEAYLGLDLGVGTEEGRAALRALPADRRWEEVAARMREHRLLGRGEDPRERVAVFARHLRGLGEHTPRRLADETTATLLVRAERRASRNSGVGMGVDDTPPGRPDLDWSRHLAGPLEVHGLDADHYGLLRPPAVRPLAELINHLLTRY
ncbi:Acyl transferase domain-containing protein [Thermomonospora echinospora]|uniref:Acyl transferase domain-containing protein n=1 Tax=Thermomonospora echinospora TaxID=1992 RepID=A0A1H6DLY0_9ACTN|nr:type I polyketide synthase [Thermomonospora echinospora]SEG86427.1 Acyl transferase domain-containing protein [Thermomonospora echinospora]